MTPPTASETFRMHVPTIHEVTDLDIPELDPFRCLKDRRLKAETDLFVAEGLEVVRRLLRSSFAVRSLLATPKKLDRLRPDLRADTSVYRASLAQMEAIAGFAIHRGVVASGVRPAGAGLAETLEGAAKPGPIVILENVNDAQNVGVIVRNAAAFGARLVVLGRCCDPFYRRAIRVSMGHVFRVPIHVSADLTADVRRIRDAYGYTVLATVTSPKATPLATVRQSPRTALLFGAEGAGLSVELQTLADLHVVIPMAPDSDSINVAVASGILLNRFSECV